MTRKMGKAASTVKWNSALKRLLMTVLFLSVAFALTACGNTNEGKQAEEGMKAAARDSKLNVPPTIGMIADVVKEEGGEHVDVIGLMGPGVDPHQY